MNRDKQEIYLPTMIKLYERLKGTCFHEGAVNNIICVCQEEDLGQWLELCPWTSEYTSRGCLVSRYSVQDDTRYHLHQSIEAFENFAVQLDRRYPDAFGPVRKAEYQRGVLQIIASFGDGTAPLDGWAVFYAYKQFVLEFLTDPRWAWFDSVRNTERYQEAVAWAKVEAEKEEGNKVS